MRYLVIKVELMPEDKLEDFTYWLRRSLPRALGRTVDYDVVVENDNLKGFKEKRLKDDATKNKGED